MPGFLPMNISGDSERMQSPPRVLTGTTQISLPAPKGDLSAFTKWGDLILSPCSRREKEAASLTARADSRQARTHIWPASGAPYVVSQLFRCGSTRQWLVPSLSVLNVNEPYVGLWPTRSGRNVRLPTTTCCMIGKLRITEHGEVYNPLFRFISRVVIGQSRTIETYLRDLGTALGQPVEIEK